VTDSAIARKKLLIVAGLCLLAIAAYWQVSDCQFLTYDDATYVTGNSHVRSGLQWSNLLWAVTATHAANWHPLTWLSHMTDCQFFGLNPAGHHLVSLAIHLANVSLLFWLLHYLTGALWRSALVAALFAVHPLNVESVAWVAERKNVLSTLFWVLTIAAYAWYATQPGWRRYLLVVAMFALGLGSKPMLVTLPFVLLLMDYWPLRRFGTSADSAATSTAKPEKRSRKTAVPAAVPVFARRSISVLILEKCPLLLMALASSVITIVAQRKGNAVGTLEAYTVPVRLENALVSYAAYLYQMVWPRGLCVLYPHPKGLLPVWQIVAAAGCLLGISGACVLWSKRFPFFAIGWLWYLGTLVPVIGIVQVGVQARADRYAYVPLVGIFIMLAWGLNEIASRWRTRQSAILAVAAGGVVLLAIVASVQAGYWRDSKTLFTRAINVTQNNYVAHNNLGEVLSLEAKYDDAAAQFAAAVSINPDYPLALNNLAMSRVQSGDLDQAIDLLSRSVEMDPSSYDAYNRLGAALLQKNRLNEAADAIHRSLELNPGFPSAYGNLGTLLEKQNRSEDAAGAYSKAIQFSLSPSFSAQMHYRLGLLLENKGEVREAALHYQEALRLKPDLAQAQQSLSTLREKAIAQ
jgi:tetratricopeptide (TPR) repeat protein